MPFGVNIFFSYSARPLSEPAGTCRRNFSQSTPRAARSAGPTTARRRRSAQSLPFLPVSDMRLPHSLLGQAAQVLQTGDKTFASGLTPSALQQSGLPVEPSSKAAE